MDRQSGLVNGYRNYEKFLTLGAREISYLNLFSICQNHS